MRLLLLDTCGEHASIALAQDGKVLRARTLPPRSASAELLATVRVELDALQWPLASLAGVGVVNGPGSFTGVRVGLAAAKGLCEVSGLPVATVSRLAVLVSAAGGHTSEVAALDAGRGEFYVRVGTDEALRTHPQLAELVASAEAGRLVVAEEKLMTALAPLRPMQLEISAASALRLVQERLSAGGDPIDTADANYVRNARTLYTAPRSASAETREP